MKSMLTNPRHKLQKYSTKSPRLRRSHDKDKRDLCVCTRDICDTCRIRNEQRIFDGRHWKLPYCAIGIKCMHTKRSVQHQFICYLFLQKLVTKICFQTSHTTHTHTHIHITKYVCFFFRLDTTDTVTKKVCNNSECTQSCVETIIQNNVSYNCQGSINYANLMFHLKPGNTNNNHCTQTQFEGPFAIAINLCSISQTTNQSQSL